MPNYKVIDIKTGFSCNNNCIMCVQADSKPLGNRSFGQIKNDLINSRERCEGVVFTGGEVTIRKDFLQLLRFAKSIGYKRIQVQSNGRKFSSLDFCMRTIEAGANEFAISLHGYCAKQHDYLTGVSGSFMETARGIKNLKSLGAYVLTNSVVVKSNYTTIPLLAKLLVKLNVDQFQIAFVHAMGNAWKNFDDVVPSIGEVAPYIHTALQIGIDSGKQVMAEAMPYCHMQGYERYISDNFSPNAEVRGTKHSDTNDFNLQRRNFGRMKFAQCKDCKYDAVCEGPWKEYPERKGDKEFVPIKKDS